ncbi:hypothetical protein [Nostoc sp. NMS8]|uniref:hypothetical protein n=1 Tax=Nostoc sp. NMS8 TaxID=2815392 RepID=UPI0025D07119|nr:hypothetical protein [Nostoc sp. NMS8]MBN3957462.1 hypothetical protein [Nostoc sp. NMS8]
MEVPLVTVSQQSHSRYGDSGVIEADAPNLWQQIVTFADGERMLVNNADLDAASAVLLELGNLNHLLKTRIQPHDHQKS